METMPYITHKPGKNKLRSKVGLLGMSKSMRRTSHQAEKRHELHKSCYRLNLT